MYLHLLSKISQTIEFIIFDDDGVYNIHNLTFVVYSILDEKGKLAIKEIPLMEKIKSFYFMDR